MPNISILRPTLLASACMLVLSACGSSDSDTTITPPTVAVDYQAVLDDAVSSTFPGVVLAISSPELDFLGSAGLADVASQTAMTPQAIMPNGSAGKKATALLVAMLHDQGALNIDDHIATWLPDSLLAQIEYSDQITLRQLLNHTAGVYDYLDDETNDIWRDAVFSNPELLKTDEYALQFALNYPAYFAPGEDFHYSNTGYLLAGLILDAILGEHHHKALRQQVLIPFGLNNTFYNGIEKDDAEIISGYYVSDDGETINTKPYYQNIGVADAPLMSTVTDMSALLKAIITDNSTINEDIRNLLIGNDSLVDLGDDVYYGLGIFKDIINGQTVYHHGGQELGYQTTNLYIADSDTTVTMFVNCHGYSACDEKNDALVQYILSTLL